MDIQQNRTVVRKAVDYLISKGKINQDKDLQQIFNLSKSTISEYINGKPGKKFIRDFEEKFEITLNEFEDNIINDSGGAKYTATKKIDSPIDYQEKYIKLLEDQTAFMQRQLETNLNDIQLSQSILLAQLKWFGVREAERFVKDDPAKLDQELSRINKHTASYLGAVGEKGKLVGS